MKNKKVLLEKLITKIHEIKHDISKEHYLSILRYPYHDEKKLKEIDKIVSDILKYNNTKN